MSSTTVSQSSLFLYRKLMIPSNQPTGARDGDYGHTPDERATTPAFNPGPTLVTNPTIGYTPVSSTTSIASNTLNSGGTNHDGETMTTESRGNQSPFEAPEHQSHRGRHVGTHDDFSQRNNNTPHRHGFWTPNIGPFTPMNGTNASNRLQTPSPNSYN